jgi:type VI secretion system protein ImpG
VEGIRNLTSRPHFARVDSDYGAVFVRGKRLDIELDEDRFAGSGVYLFGAVLDRFFGAYTSLNSFTELHVTTPQRAVGDFLPRAGHRIVA